MGLFVIEDFLDAGTCADVRTEMRSAAPQQATIISASGESLIDEHLRRVTCVSPKASVETLMTSHVEAIRPRIEDHFGIRLNPNPQPEFLVYREGAFYTPHTDTGRNPENEVYSRRVSLVIFLNQASKEPGPENYGGGELRFYGLIREPRWTDCAFALDPLPGMLIAFPSNVRHEVTPVTFGERFTIVSWFLQHTGPDR